jgi:VanZ family protein
VNDHRTAQRVAVLIPIVALVLACTAIPTELSWPDRQDLLVAASVRLDASDVIANVVGYLPLGVAIARAGTWPALGVAASISLIAETTQLFSTGRTPSVIDLLTNTLGAALGLLIAARWNWPVLSLKMGRRPAAVAASLALLSVGVCSLGTPSDVERTAVALHLSPPWLAVSPRGDSAPGRLEARWTFDEPDNAAVRDESGNGLNGSAVNAPTRVAGVSGQAVSLNGYQYIDLGDPLDLRLAGSLTISAWINSSFFPLDDANIVSNYHGLGYQLDTTVDEGPRTIGFKLTDWTGRMMARYGRTPLETNRWYHVAGVYDAAARTLNVYLNGQLDNGCLLGSVPAHQRVSAGNVFVGRRGDGGYEFSGALDDVRIYSRALSAHELQDMVHFGAPSDAVSSNTVKVQPSSNATCTSADPTDSRVTIVVFGAGMLIAVACVGWWPRPTPQRHVAILGLSLVAGVSMLFLLGPAVPTFFRWMIPWLSLAGGSTIVMSAQA